MKRIFRKTFSIVSISIFVFASNSFIVSSAKAQQGNLRVIEAAQTELDRCTNRLSELQSFQQDCSVVQPVNVPQPVDCTQFNPTDVADSITEMRTCITTQQNIINQASSTATGGATAPATTTKTQTTTQTTLYNPLGTTSIESFIGRTIRIVLGMAGIAAFLMFIWGGILWMTSAGNADRIQKGKDTLIWATIGLVVLFSAYAIVETLVKALSTGGI